MITKEEIKESARFYHMKPYQQEKHYIQTIVLNSIYSSVSNELVFKGGTCMLFFYGLNRFSEDLDFTMAKGIDTKKIVSAVKRDLENLGINCRISKIEEDETSVYFKIGAEGPLYTQEIERCFVSVEISKREIAKNFRILELRSPYKEVIGFSVCVMDEKEILAEKIRALVTRNQARDLFDAYFLLKKGVKPEIELINKKLGYYNKKFDTKKIFTSSDFRGAQKPLVFDKKEIARSIRNKKELWFSELKPLIIGTLPPYEQVKKEVEKFIAELK